LETIQIDKIPKENKLGTDGQTDEFKKGEVPTRQVPYTPQMNSIAERTNQRMFVVARALLKQAFLSPEWWGEALTKQ